MRALDRIISHTTNCKTKTQLGWTVCTCGHDEAVVELADLRSAVDNTIYKLIEKFPAGTKIIIEPVMYNHYYIGYERGNHKYIPGFGSYDTLDEALKKCFSAYVANEMMTVDK